MRLIILIFCLLCPIWAAAQQDDRSFLEAWLADQLSTQDRLVKIEGFTGALSARAQMRRLIIEDAQGPWLIAQDLTLDWDRAALLGGALVVNELSAQSVHVLRAPPSDPQQPKTGFSLPQLPVSIDIAALRLDHLQIDTPVFGHALRGRLSGAVVWTDDGRQVQLDIQRQDAVAGHIALSLGQSGADAQIVANLSAQEDTGGLVAHLLGLPNAPALKVQGDFTALGADWRGDLQVMGDDTPLIFARLRPAAADKAAQYAVEIDGDLRPFLPPGLHSLLGSQAQLLAQIAPRDGGGWDLVQMTADLPWIQATGSGAIDAGGALQWFDLRATAGLPDLPDILPAALHLKTADVALSLADENAEIQLYLQAKGLAFGPIGYDVITANGSAPRRGNGPAQLSVQAQGAMDARLDGVLPSPQLSVQLSNLLAWRDADILAQLRDDKTVSRAKISGIWSGGVRVETVLAAGVLGDIRPFGQIELIGDLRRKGDSQIAITSQSGAKLDISGQLGGAPNLTFTAQAPASVADPWLTPRQLRGVVTATGGLQGGWALDGVTLTAQSDGLSLVDPDFGAVVQNAALLAQLQGSSLIADLRSPDDKLSVKATIDLLIGSQTVELRLQDKPLSLGPYGAADVTAKLRFMAAAQKAAQFDGQITLGRAELRLPDQLGSSGPAPLAGVQHINAAAAVTASLARAGLTPTPQRPGPTRPVTVDITLDAPSRIFLRGRGIDAEFAGSLRLNGAVGAVKQQGQFNLLRGRMDLLGQRLDLTEGRLLFRGASLPQVSMQAQAQRDGTQITIALTGPIDAPDITISSTPTLPEAEALALLIFGTDAGRLSSLQALQLVAALRSLSGKDIGITERLRRATGVDDFDVQTDAQGQSAVRLGKYLGENLYTTLTLGASGQTQIELNLDLNDNITAKTSIGSEGGQGVGLYYERDY